MPEFVLTDSDVIATAHLTAGEAAKQLSVGVATIHRARKRLNLATKSGRPKTVMIEDRDCPVCGAAFAPRSETSLYCSVQCFHKVRPPIGESTKSTISAKAKLRWSSPTPAMLDGIEKRKLKDLDSYRKYRNRLKVLTEKTYTDYKSEINPNRHVRGVAGTDGAYHLDHIIPARFGFENGIPPEVLADKQNLQMLPWIDNIRKGRKYDQV